MMKTSAAAIRYDFLTNTLYVTKAYLDAAGVFGSPEYKEIKKYRDDNAGMKIEVVKRTASKSDNRPVTVKYADMEHFIRQFPQECQEGLLARYKKVKALSKTHRSPYKFVLDWFLDYFPLYNNDVVLEWHDYVEKEREAELSTIIAEENLKEAETRKFIENAFRDGEIKTIGTDIEAILPPVSNFGGKKARKKQTVIEKLKAFFERFFGIGSAFTAEK